MQLSRREICGLAAKNPLKQSILGQPANPGSRGKMAVKMECVCVLDSISVSLTGIPVLRTVSTRRIAVGEAY